MRLSGDQVKHFIQVLRDALPSTNFALYLFGSRVDDDLKGGDIDLALKVPTQDLQNTQDQIYRILAAFKQNPVVGDRRIDLKVFDDLMLETDPFIKVISSKWIEL